MLCFNSLSQVLHLPCTFCRDNAQHYENVNMKKEEKKCEHFIPRYHESVTLQEQKKVKLIQQ